MDPQDSLVKESRDPLIRWLNKSVVLSVKLLAILMVIVIWWASIDVLVLLGQQMINTSYAKFNIENLITVLGSFLAVLIAIEIFLNIVFYLKRDAIHVPLVLSTALTAIARKVIVLDYSVTTPMHIFATAATVIAVGITYWLVTKKTT